MLFDMNIYKTIISITQRIASSSRGVMGLNLVLSDKVFFSVDSGSLGHA